MPERTYERDPNNPLQQIVVAVDGVPVVEPLPRVKWLAKDHAETIVHPATGESRKIYPHDDVDIVDESHEWVKKYRELEAAEGIDVAEYLAPKPLPPSIDELKATLYQMSFAAVDAMAKQGYREFLSGRVATGTATPEEVAEYTAILEFGASCKAVYDQTVSELEAGTRTNIDGVSFPVPSA
ncbi:MAG: hypothetical protein AAFX06_29685 [Planctomycetota bacterium]